MVQTLVVIDYERQKIQELAQQYINEGYEVIFEPKPDQLPFDLQGYQPDLIALKEKEGIIIEVTSRSSNISLDRLQTTAKKVRQQAGWRFVLVTVDDNFPDALPGLSPEFLSWPEVIHRIDRADRLAALGETESAYLILWIAFEHMMRLRVQAIDLPIDHLSAVVLINQLDDCEEMSLEQYDQAIDLQETHNLVVHGVPVPDLAARFNRLRELVQDRSIAWQPPTKP